MSQVVCSPSYSLVIESVLELKEICAIFACVDYAAVCYINDITDLTELLIINYNFKFMINLFLSSVCEELCLSEA